MTLLKYKSDHATLPKMFQQLPSHSNKKFLTKTYTTCLVWSPISSLTPLPGSHLDSHSCSHSNPLLCLKPTGHIFHVRPLHVHFSLPGTLMPSKPTRLTPLLLEVFIHITFLETPSLLKLSKISTHPPPFFSIPHYQTQHIFY